MEKKAMPIFEAEGTLYVNHPFYSGRQFVCAIPAGQVVSCFVPADASYKCRRYRIKASERDRVLIMSTMPVSATGNVALEIEEYYAPLVGAVKKERIL